MTSSHALEARINQLRRMGPDPDWRVFQRILAHGPEALPGLLRLATNTPDLFAPLPTTLGPIHALRLLGEIPDVSLIDPLLHAFVAAEKSTEELDDFTNQPIAMYAFDLLHVIGRIGAPAIEPLWAYCDDPQEKLLIQVTALQALAHVATFDPSQREPMIHEAHRRISASDHTRINICTAYVRLLADMRDAPSYKLIMELFRAKRINSQVFPAAEARQMLLGNQPSPLNCVKHSLEERYAEHALHDIKAYANPNANDNWED